MEIKINIITDDTCGILILDATKYQTEGEKGFKKTDVVSAVILEKMPDENIVDEVLGDTDGVFKLNPKADGYYKVTMVLIPTEDYFKTHFIDTSIINYYSDGLKIYKYFNSTVTEVPLEEVSRVYVSNVLRAEQTLITVCRLRHCYIKLCRDSILNIDKCAPINNNKNFNRDLVWMTLNVVEYLTDFNLEEDAGNILDLMQGCYGICKPRYSKENKNECRCS